MYSKKLGKYYYGSTQNLKIRLERHNIGREKYTKKGVPWRLIWAQSFDSRSEAYKTELMFKKFKSQKRMLQYINLNPTQDLTEF